MDVVAAKRRVVDLDPPREPLADPRPIDLHPRAHEHRAARLLLRPAACTRHLLLHRLRLRQIYRLRQLCGGGGGGGVGCRLSESLSQSGGLAKRALRPVLERTTQHHLVRRLPRCRTLTQSPLPLCLLPLVDDVQRVVLVQRMLTLRLAHGARARLLLCGYSGRDERNDAFFLSLKLEGRH
eukprot:scaffold56018_cov62-Phaeocystis_antarctica.AAC.1